MMKNSAFKYLALGGVALAAYPVMSTFRSDLGRANVSKPPQISPQLQMGSSLQDRGPSPEQKSETAMSLSAPAQISGLGTTAVIKPDPSGHFVTKAIINGISLPLIFDTGASIVALSYEDAVKLGFRLNSADFRSKIQTANGMAPAAEINLKEIQIESISVNNIPAMVLPPGKLDMSLLGRSFWGQLKTGFSFSDGNLVLKN